MQKLPGKNEQIIGSVKRQRKLPKAPPIFTKYLKSILLALLVAVLLGVGIFIWQRHRQANNEDKTYSIMISSVNNNLRAGHVGVAKLQLEDYLKQQNPQKANHLLYIYSQLASIYSNLGDFKKSASYGIKALKYNPKPMAGSYLLIAEPSAKSGDTQTAIEYYQKALNELKTATHPTAGAETYSIEMTINSLKASQK